MELNQITSINEEKRFQIQTLITFHIANMNSKDLKRPQMTSLNLKQIKNLIRETKTL